MEFQLRKFIFAIVFASTIPKVKDESACSSPQYLQRGQRGIVHCSFSDQFFGVYWYNSTNYLEEPRPTIYYSNKQRDGEGYLSGEFDILEDGSLVINNVSFQHDHGFTVIMFRTKTEETIPIYVDTVVIVKPLQAFPKLDKCDDNKVCLIDVDQPVELSCYVNNSRPPVNLTFYENHNLKSTATRTFGKTLYTSIIRVNLPEPSMLTLYVCMASNIPYLMDDDKSMILILNSGVISKAEPIRVVAEQSTSVVLSCSIEPIFYAVWMTEESYTTVSIAYSIIWNNFSWNETNKPYMFVNNTSLMIPHLTDQEDGMYLCVVSDGKQEQIKKFNITVYVKPNPYYLRIDGCSAPKQRCLLSVQRTGQLTCTLQRTRPIVALQFRFANEVPEGSMFHDGVHTIEKREGSTYDITVSSNFYIGDASDDGVIVECFVEKNEWSLEWSNWSTKVELLFPPVYTPPGIVLLLSTTSGKIYLAIWVITPVTVLAIALFICWKLRRITGRGTTPLNLNEEETIPLTSTLPSYNSQGRLRKFQREIESRYKEVCETMKLIPNSKTEHQISDWFIEGDLIEKHINSHGEERWVKVATYDCIINPNDINYRRIIIQGESGYGKTLLCRKIAYDWSSNREGSPLVSVGIVIYLPVRLLADLPLCVAIKQYLLPEDTSFEIEEIKQLLSSVTSVIVLDGFSRFPANASYERSELQSILMYNAFQSSQVIVTALPDSLPEAYAKITRQMKLIGFSESTQRKYIEDFVAKEDPNGAKRINSFFLKNNEVSQFCHIPLLFVLLTHLIYREQLSMSAIQNFKKVTQIFQSIIQGLSCQKNEVVEMNDVHDDEETIHDDKLAEATYNLLMNSTEGYRFNKKELIDELGEKLYKYYVNTMGLLVEEKMFCKPSNKTQSVENGKLNQPPEVRFYHIIFLEYFAAHKLIKVAEDVTNATSLEEILRKIKPLHLQYIYRFACGLSEKAALNIVQCLESKEEFRKFSQVCIVEQKGGADKIMKEVEKLCGLPVTITNDDDVVHQRSVVQLLEMASKEDILIEVLWLQVSPVSFNSEFIEFGSGVKLHKLDTLQQFSITNSTKFSENEMGGLLTYASMCKNLMCFRLRGCLLPRHVQDDAMKILDKANVSVEWILPVPNKPRYILNLKSGYWEIKKKRMSDKEYQRAATVLGFQVDENKNNQEMEELVV